MMKEDGDVGDMLRRWGRGEGDGGVGDEGSGSVVEEGNGDMQRKRVI